MKSLIRLFIVLLFLVSVGLSYAKSEVDNCFNYLKAGDYQRAISAGKRAVKLYPGNSDAHLCLGIAYYKVGELDKALRSMKEAERLATDKRDLAIIYNRLGLIYDNKGDLDNALFYYNKDLGLSKELGDKRGEAAALNNIATIYEKKRMLDKALEYYEQSLRLQYDEKEKARTYNNIALVYYKKGEYPKAVEYLKKAIEIGERAGDYHGVAQRMLNLGNTYRKMKDFDSASNFLNEGLKRIQKVGDKLWEATAYKYLGWLYRDMGNTRLAKDYLTRAYNLFKSIGAEEDAEDALLSLLGLEAQKKR